ncbi:hypothetical protein [Streptosporangium sp. KLBMP 9127]|nr:hypothetical protein [Streptosporangium sp. KLBMP 9127]
MASYRARFEAGEALSEAFIVVHEGAGPEADRVVHEKAEGGTFGGGAVVPPDVIAP